MINLLIDEWRQKSFDKHPCRIDEVVQSAHFLCREREIWFGSIADPYHNEYPSQPGCCVIGLAFYERDFVI